MKTMNRSWLPPVLAAIVLAGALAGCGTAGPNQTAGTLLGAAGGAVAGAQFGQGNGRLAAVALGTLAGAAIGNTIGTSVDTTQRGAASTPTASPYDGPRPVPGGYGYGSYHRGPTRYGPPPGRSRRAVDVYHHHYYHY